jgi:hypothetical protein
VDRCQQTHRVCPFPLRNRQEIIEILNLGRTLS